MTLPHSSIFETTPVQPPRSLPHGSPLCACVDIGGTKVSVILASDKGFTVALVEPTAKSGAPDALGQQVLRMIEQSCVENGWQRADVQRVGVSSCGPFIMTPEGVELAAPNICGGIAGPERGLPNTWTSAILEAPLRRAFARVRVANDGIGALEAERRWGALQVGGQALSHCAYVTWSTGIGVGLCVDGTVLQGKNGNAGHGGHTFVSTDHSALCGCGNVGDVEALVAGNALPRRFAHLGYGSASSLFDACAKGEPQALSLVDDLCHIMGRMLFNLIALTDLARISVGGSVFWHNQALLLPLLRQHALGHLPALTQGVEIVPAGLGERVGDFAALALVID